MEREEKRLPLKKALEEGSAVQIAAAGKAKKENVSEPESRHYKEASGVIDELREFDPKMAERYIRSTLKAEEINKEMGPVMADVFEGVAIKITEYNLKKSFKAVQIFAEKGFLLKDKEVVVDMIATIFSGMMDTLKEELENDPRVKEAFKGREEYIEKALKLIRKDRNLTETMIRMQLDRIV